MDKTLVISDFGMSCPTDAVGSHVSGVGTAAYAAPEVICMEIFSLASDVWSYGVVLWEIFTMLEPFKEFDRAQQLVNIGRYRQKLFIPRSDSGFPQVVGALLARCWADEQMERPTFCDICNYLLDAQYDAFFSLSMEEFVTLQDVWIREIFDEAELSLLSESCSSEASSSLRRQNEHLQQEIVKMRDALHALKQNEEHYRGAIAGLQKDNQILSVLVANTLYSNVAPAPRKKPLMYNFFRRNEPKTSVVNTSVEGKTAPIAALPGAGAVTTADRSPREVSPAMKPSGWRHGGHKTYKSTLGISYPFDVRHVVHVPGNLFFKSSSELYPSTSKCNVSSGNRNTLMDPSSPSSPANPALFADGSISSSSYLHPHMDNQCTHPSVRSSNFMFSPTDEAADIAQHFAFLYTQNSLNGAAPSVSQMPSQILQRQHHQRISKSNDTAGLTSYKSAPELCEQIGCFKASVNNLEGRHTVSRGSAIDSTSIPPTTSSTSSAHGSSNTSKHHRIGLSALFHTSRSKHSSVSGRPSSPTLEPVVLSPVPSQIPATSSNLLSSAIPLLSRPSANSTSGVASQPSRSFGKHKPISTAPRRLLLQKFFQTDHSRQRRAIGGSRKLLDSIKKRRYSTSPDSLTILSEETVQGNPSLESMKETMEASQSTCVPATTQIPPLPPSRLREPSPSGGPRRRLLDIIPPPPSRVPTASPIPRPCTLSATSDGDTKSGMHKDSFVPPLKSLSQTITVEAKGKQNEDDVGEETGGLALVNPVPLALWSALHVVSITPLLLDCNAKNPIHPRPSIASRSASFARVTSSPFTLDESDYESDVPGKGKSHLNRTSSPLALTTSSIDRSRQHTRRQLSTRELSATSPSSSSWQGNANQLPPVYHSPPPRKEGVWEGTRRETCCNCGCHSVTGGSRQSSSFAIATISESSSPWLPVDNPVALSRDAYLKVTQDGYLNRLAVDETLDGGGLDIKNDSRSTSLALTPRSLRGFSPSTLFSPDVFHQKRQDHSSISQRTYFFDSLCEAVEGGEGEETGEPSFGAGEAAEDTVTRHAEFQILPQTLEKTVYESKEEVDCRNGCRRFQGSHIPYAKARAGKRRTRYRAAHGIFLISLPS